MAEKMTVLNRGVAPIILRDKRKLMPGEAAEVPAEEGKALLTYRGVVDASKIVKGGGDNAELEKLRAENEKLKARNKELEQGGGSSSEGGEAWKPKKGAAVLLPSGGTGVIVKLLSKKDMEKVGLAAERGADVKLDENGNVSPFDLDQLKPAPKAE